MSSEAEGAEVDVRALTDAEVESRIEHGPALVAFGAAVVEGDDATLERARAVLAGAMGEAAMVDAAGVASNFMRMVRIADATGIELGERMEEESAAVRAELGLARPAGR